MSPSSINRIDILYLLLTTYYISIITKKFYPT